MKITGIPVGGTSPRADWNQTDPAKADFIKNKPDMAAYCKKSATYTATPQTLQQVLASAEPNATVQLTEGVYNIVLKGRASYPENLTIKGGNGAKVNGVQISSGLNQEYYFKRVDISESVMPKGLSFVGINFTNDFILRNCAIENLTINGCYFSYGAAINICPNNLEPDSTNPGLRYKHAMTRVKNLLIRGNTITNAANEDESAILILEADGVTVCNNTINNAAHNGIQIAGRGNGYSTTGKIHVGNNTISNTGSFAINIANTEEAQLYAVGNKLNNANKKEANTACISVTNCAKTTYCFKTGENNSNTYAGAPIHEGNIVITSLLPREDTHIHSKKYVGLGNVPNVTTNDQTPTYTEAEEIGVLVSGETLSTAFGKIAKAISCLANHLLHKSNPHEVAASQLGIADYVIEHKTVGATRYRKWSGGLAEIWIAQVPYEISDHNGNLTVELPIALVNGEDFIQYQVTAFPSGCTGNLTVSNVIPQLRGTTCIGVDMNFAPLGEALPLMAEIHLYITGRWK